MKAKVTDINANGVTNGYVLTAQAGLATWAASAGGGASGVTSVNTRTGDVTLSKSDVGLANVDNVADANKPVSTAQQTALNLKSDLASPTFTGTPAAPTATAGTNTTQLATTAFVTAGLTLKANIASPTFTGTPAAPTAAAGTSTTQIATTAFVAAAITAGAGVTSVNTRTGAVTLSKSDVGLANVDNTSDANKPVSTAQQTALDLKANLASPTLTGTPLAPTAAAGTNTTQVATTAYVTTAVATREPTITAGTTAQYWRGDKSFQTLDKSAVGLANVDNTSDANKPVSSATQTALNLKANIASPTFTGTPAAPTPAAGTNTTQVATTAFVTAAVAAGGGGGGSGVSSVNTRTGAVTLDKSDVGLSNVDNTSDANKPVSSAQQTALDAKAPLASPALTGTPTVPTAAAGNNSTQAANTAFVANAIAGKSVIIDVFNSSSGWLKRDGLVGIQILCIGAGGGGGGGKLGATTTLRTAGAGGGAGATAEAPFIAASVLGNIEVVTVGLGGSGGNASTSTGSGGAGSTGGFSAFGPYVQANGGVGGNGGTSSGAATGGAGGAGQWIGSNGGASAATGATGTLGTGAGLSPGSGGAGGGLTTADVRANGVAGGRAGGQRRIATNSGGGGGAGGSAGTTNDAAPGGDGVAIPNGDFAGGAGGGGGGAGQTSIGGNGGAGSQPGGGGGGGGASGGSQAGTGGRGGDGRIMIINFF